MPTDRVQQHSAGLRLSLHVTRPFLKAPPLTGRGFFMPVLPYSDFLSYTDASDAARVAPERPWLVTGHVVSGT